MSREIRGLARDGSIYAITSIIGRSAGIVLIPVYSHYLSVVEYAIYGVLFSVMELGSLVLGMGLNAALARLYFEKPDDTVHQNKVIGSILTGYIIFALVAVALFFALSPMLSPLVLGQDAGGILLGVAMMAVMLTILSELTVGYYLVRKNQLAIAIMAVGKAVLLLSTNLLFVIVFDWGVLGIVLAMALSFALIGVSSAVIILFRTGLHLDMSIIKATLKFGLPLVPSAGANSVMKVVERRLLAVQGPTAVAVFSLGDRLVSLLQLFVAGPFSQIFFVRRFETLAKNEDQTEMSRILLIFVGVIALAALGFSSFGKEALAIIAPSYFGAAIGLLPWFALYYVASSLTVNIELGLLYAKKTIAIPVIGVSALIVSVALNLVVIPVYGAIGAVIVGAAVAVLRLIVTIVVNQRVGTADVTAPWPRVAAILGAALCLGVLQVNVIAEWPLLLSFFARGLCWVLFAVALVAGPFLDRDTRQGLAAAVRPNKEAEGRE